MTDGQIDYYVAMAIVTVAPLLLYRVGVLAFDLWLEWRARNK